MDEDELEGVEEWEGEDVGEDVGVVVGELVGGGVTTPPPLVKTFLTAAS